MSDKRLRISRRRLLAGISTIGGASAAAGMGTMAALSDSETSEDNHIEAGTLDLELNGPDPTATFLEAEEMAPGDTGSQSMQLENVGTVPGTLEIVVEAVRDFENGLANNENSQDSSLNEGELQNYVEVRALVDGDPVTNWRGLDEIQSQSLPVTVSTERTIEGQTSRQFTVEWDFNDPGDNSVNDAQSDRVELDLTFRLVGGS